MKKLKKISAIKTTLIVLTVLIATLVFLSLVSFKHGTKKYSETGLNSKTTIYQNYKKAPTNSNVSFEVYKSELIYGVNEQENVLVTSNLQLKQILMQKLKTDVVQLENMIMSDEIFNDEFFKENNLAILTSEDTLTFNSIVKNNDNVTINISSRIIIYSEGLGLEDTNRLFFITLDKDIKNVNFKIYKTNEKWGGITSEEERKSLLLPKGIAVCVISIILTILVIANHNYKVNCIENNIVNKKWKIFRILGIVLFSLIELILVVAFYVLSYVTSI